MDAQLGMARTPRLSLTRRNAPETLSNHHSHRRVHWWDARSLHRVHARCESRTRSHPNAYSAHQWSAPRVYACTPDASLTRALRAR
jgi:hypothetical protein